MLCCALANRPTLAPPLRHRRLVRRLAFRLSPSLSAPPCRVQRTTTDPSGAITSESHQDIRKLQCTRPGHHHANRRGGEFHKQLKSAVNGLDSLRGTHTVSTRSRIYCYTSMPASRRRSTTSCRISSQLRARFFLEIGLFMLPTIWRASCVKPVGTKWGGRSLRSRGFGEEDVCRGRCVD